ncbi:MAG TPA: hypothetical protein VF704_09865 [Allosphingosinicella sp.]
MNLLALGAALALAGVAAAQQEPWSGDGWAPTHGRGMGLGRTEGPVSIDLFQSGDDYTVSVLVRRCGGPRDARAFETDVDGGPAQSRELNVAIVRMLGEARRLCGVGEDLTARIADGFEPAFAAYLHEQSTMDMGGLDLNMIDLNAADCAGGGCNVM